MAVVRYGAAARGHVMNPATGWPAHALVQASVVSRSAVAADALSTAMLVSGRRPPGALEAYSICRNELTPGASPGGMGR